MTAHRVADKLIGLEWLGIPFAGGMSELAHVSCRSIVVNDLHRHVMNLAAVVADRAGDLRNDLAKAPFHPDSLAACQLHCRRMEGDGWDTAIVCDKRSYDWAFSYFVCCWMGRSAKAGTSDEFKGGLPIRWNANGGDSNTRYRSAIESIDEWSAVMRRCNFATLDFREFLAKCKDQPRHGIYADPPFPEGGQQYKHTFTETDHHDLATSLGAFQQTRVVIRYYDHPLIRELYPVDRWKWHEFAGRKQSNEESPEVLITNGK